MQIFLNNQQWKTLEGEICRVLTFTPLSATFKNGALIVSNRSEPYAEIEFESSKFEGIAKGYITHKTDFAMLWSVFNEPLQISGVHTEIKQTTNSDGSQISPSNNEVWVSWTDSRFTFFANFLKFLFPRLIVWICPKGAFKLAINDNLKPELGGQARWLAMAPLVTMTPEVMVR